jgi:putative membrane protein
MLLDLVSPIDTLGDVYLFSAHVLQHFLLALVIPALFVLGTPRSLAVAIGRWDRIPALVAWSLGVGTMIAWHIPALFNAALANDALHIAQHLSFLATGTIFWWPVLHPVEKRRLTALGSIAYLFSACTFCSILGAALTFAPTGLYPAYLNPNDQLGILRLVRDTWGMDRKSDQQLGGMLMWVPGCLVYLTGILATAARWFHAQQEAPA